MLIISEQNCALLERSDLMEQLEVKADQFAQNYLIPAHEYKIFLNSNNFSELSVKYFAKSMGIHAGIVVGRLQREGRIGYDRLNGLKGKYTIVV